MSDSTILTITSNEEFLVVLRQQLHDQVGSGSRMIVAGTIDEACSLLDTARPRIVVVHCAGDCGRYDQLDKLLWATTVLARPVPVLVIADRYRTDQATMLFRMGVSEYISRTHHIDQLGAVFAAYLPRMPKLAQHTVVETSPAEELVKTRPLSPALRPSVSQVV